MTLPLFPELGEQIKPEAKPKAASKKTRSPSPSVDVEQTSPKTVSLEPLKKEGVLRFVSYTDGACSGNPGPAGLGLVLIGPEETLLEYSEPLGHATNNIAELTAILRALEKTPAGCEILIHTDSQYAIGVLTKAWKAKANQELIQTIKAKIKEKKLVSFKYVKAHAGIPLNEKADELARFASLGRATLP